jgi:hypothetical protein
MTARSRSLAAAMTAVGAMAVAWQAPASSLAVEGPIKEVVASHFGREVNLTEASAHGGPQLEDVCTVESLDQCQPGRSSAALGGFENPQSVAVDNDPTSPAYGDLYVVDNTDRVELFTPAGVFVRMFGWEVNETKDKEPSAAQAERNVCTAASGDSCKVGVEGAAPGQFREPSSVAVDATSGDVYVADGGVGPTHGRRVQSFTSSGGFVMEIGKEVNETTHGNLCTEQEVEESSVKCGGAAPSSSEQGAFVAQGVLTVGGPKDILYVGDEHRVQEFESNGQYRREIDLTPISAEPQRSVRSLAVDGSGDLYLDYGEGSKEILEFDEAGKEIGVFATEFVSSVATDSAGRLAVSESVFDGVQASPRLRGSLYSVLGAGKFHLVTEFVNPGDRGIAFSDKNDMYAAAGAPTSISSASNEIVKYSPVSVGELLSGGATCKEGAPVDTNVTIDCVVEGEVDPWGVAETEVWLQYGSTPALGLETPKQPVGEGNTLVGVSAEVQGLRPDNTLHYRLAGEDSNVKDPELLTSEGVSAKTPTVPPRIVGEPSVTHVHSASAVMFGRLNPENTSTRYGFQYAPTGACANLAESCPGLAETGTLEAPDYGAIGVTLEASGLQPSTSYRYRLFAANEKKEVALAENGGPQLPEGTFTTAPAPELLAMTGDYTALGPTSATVSGTVQTGGQPATYAFELGLDNGAATNYGTVLTGPAGPEDVAAEKTVALAGLQPGTRYAYRISVTSGYGAAYGEARTFTTVGAAAVIFVPAPLGMLPTPSVNFPNVPRMPARCKPGFRREKHGKCVKTKTKVKKGRKKIHRKK